MTRDANAALAATLVDEWARAGITDACVTPGSRNAPLALALAHDRRLRVHTHLDERAAAFFAVGAARASRRPVVVCCTSGTAAAHLHPAVLEASHGRVPLLVCTADRPPELRDTGAGQTIDQVGLYGDAVRWAFDVEAPADRPGIGNWWRSLGARSVASATGPPAGPVHLNLAFRDPLAPTGEPLVDAPGRPDGRPWTVTSPPRRVLDDGTLDELAVIVADHPRGLVVAGWDADAPPDPVERFAAAAGWPVLADPLSGLRRGPTTIAAHDPLLRDAVFAAAHHPDLVLRLGAPPTGPVGTDWLAGVAEQWLVDPDQRWLDPAHRARPPPACRRRPAPRRARGPPASRRPDSGVVVRVARRRPAGPAGDRRPAHRHRRALRGSHRPRRRRRAPRRVDARRRVQHAGSRRPVLRAGPRRAPLPLQPGRERHRRVRVDRARCRRGVERTDRRARRRPLVPPRRAGPPQRHPPRAGRGARRRRQRRRRDLLVPALRRHRRSRRLRPGSRHPPRRRPPPPRRRARRPRRRRREGRARCDPPWSTRSRQAGSGSSSPAPTGPRTSTATGRSGRRSATPSTPTDRDGWRLDLDLDPAGPAEVRVAPGCHGCAPTAAGGCRAQARADAAGRGSRRVLAPRSP